MLTEVVRGSGGTDKAPGLVELEPEWRDHAAQRHGLWRQRILHTQQARLLRHVRIDLSCKRLIASAGCYDRGLQKPSPVDCHRKLSRIGLEAAVSMGRATTGTGHGPGPVGDRQSPLRDMRYLSAALVKLLRSASRRSIAAMRRL